MLELRTTRWRWYISMVALAAAVFTASASAPGRADAVAVNDPGSRPYLAHEDDFPDPGVMLYNGTYYAYATNGAGGNMPVLTSTSLYGTWVPSADALPVLGSWANPGYTWAPDVSRLPNGTFIVYYTAADKASGRQCVGAAIATNPAGQFSPVGSLPLICPASEGGAIDASAFTDTDGQRYIAYKVDGNALGLPTTLYLQKVNADGVTLVGPRIPTISNNSGEGPLVEAPYLLKHNGTYVLLYSYGHYGDNTYTEGYATASSLSGPWTKGPPLMTTAYFNALVSGPGGASVVSDASGDHIVFHGVKLAPSWHRPMFVSDITWNSNGVPTVSRTCNGACTQFGSSQGANGWSYQDNVGGVWQNIQTYTPNGFLGMRQWHDDPTGGYVWPGGQHPGAQNDTARTWSADRNGIVDISGQVAKIDQRGDGVTVRITKNGVTVWGPAAIAPADTIGIAASPQNVAVGTGDQIRFEINRGPAGDWSNDSTSWDPTVTYRACSTACNPLLPLNTRRSLQSVTPGFTNLSLRHANGLAYTSDINSASSALDKSDATWTIRAGLANPACYTFESVNRPGNFLRHFNSRVMISPDDGSALMHADATWCAQQPLSGSVGVSLQAYQFPDSYMRHYNGEVWAANGATTGWNRPLTWAVDSTWNVIAPWSP